MDQHADTTSRFTAIYNAAWPLRNCRRHQRAERAAAIHALGLACREAFNATDDFEPLLTAIVDAVVPRDPRF